VWRLGGGNRHSFEVVSNLLVKRKGWHKNRSGTGRLATGGQQIVWKIQAEFGLLKRKKENVQKFLRTEGKTVKNEIYCICQKINR